MKKLFIVFAFFLFPLNNSFANCCVDPLCDQSTISPESYYGNRNFTVQGEFLWWRSHIKGTPFVVTHETVFDFLPTKSKLIHTHFKFSPGFRINFKYSFPCDNYDLGISWTRFSQKAHKTVTATDGITLLSVWDTFGFILPTTATANSHEKLQLIDAVFGKTFYGDCLSSLRCFFGLRGGNVKQLLKIVYEGTETAEGILSPVKVNLLNDFKGVGILTGFNFVYKFPYNFGFYGKGEIAALVGKTTIKEDEFLNIVTDTTPVSTINSDSLNKVSAIKLNVALGAGIQWDTCLWNDRLAIGLNLGYEFSYWPNQMFLQKMLPVDAQSILIQQPGDVSFSGLVLGGFIAF